MKKAVDRGVEDLATAGIAAVSTPVVAAAARPVVHKVSRWWPLLLIGPMLTVGAVLLAGMLVLTSLVASQADASLDRTAASSNAWCFAGDVEAPDWDDEQLEVAVEIAEVWKRNSFPAKALVTAYATGIVESGMRNLDYGDRDSLGWAQQRPSTGWGTESQVQDVRLAAEAFFGVASHTDNPGLVDIPDWESRPVGEVAQEIQRSAFPTRYTDVEQQAQSLASLIIDEDVVTCQPIGLGQWIWPLAEGTYPATFTDGQKFGMRVHPVTGVYKLHTGLDFSAPASTPIMAASGGVVEVSAPGGAWGNQVIIDHGGGVKTRYAHASELLVDAGETVPAGQTIALVGSTGYSTGNHLHWEVLVDERPVDPLVWMEQRKDAPPENPVEPGGTLSMITYNVHYGRPEKATKEVAGLAARRSPDVICLQEAAGVRRAPAGYRIWRPVVNGTRTATPLVIRDGLTVTNRGSIELTGRTWVGEAGAGPPKATPRHIVWATLDGQVTVGCTHFTASKDASRARAELWRKQAEGSVRFLAGGGPRLLGGDFNAQPNSPWMEGFRDVATVDSNRGNTHPGGRIDMVWGSRPLIPGSSRVLPRMGSDHSPLLTFWSVGGEA